MTDEAIYGAYGYDEEAARHEADHLRRRDLVERFLAVMALHGNPGTSALDKFPSFDQFVEDVRPVTFESLSRRAMARKAVTENRSYRKLSAPEKNLVTRYKMARQNPRGWTYETWVEERADDPAEQLYRKVLTTRGDWLVVGPYRVQVDTPDSADCRQAIETILAKTGVESPYPD